MFLDEQGRKVIFKIAVVGTGARATCRRFARTSWLDRWMERFSRGVGDGYEVKSDVPFRNWEISSTLVPVDDRAHLTFVLRNADGCVLLDSSGRDAIEAALRTLGVPSASMPVEASAPGDLEASLRALLRRVIDLAQPALDKQQK